METQTLSQVEREDQLKMKLLDYYLSKARIEIYNWRDNQYRPDLPEGPRDFDQPIRFLFSLIARMDTRNTRAYKRRIASKHIGQFAREYPEKVYLGENPNAASEKAWSDYHEHREELAMRYRVAFAGLEKHILNDNPISKQI